jgi:hypothetical protein
MITHGNKSYKSEMPNFPFEISTDISLVVKVVSALKQHAMKAYGGSKGAALHIGVSFTPPSSPASLRKGKEPLARRLSDNQIQSIRGLKKKTCLN